MKKNILVGFEAIEYAEAKQLELNKYADPIEGAREDVTPEDAREIAAEDPSLIWVEEVEKRFYVTAFDGDTFKGFAAGPFDSHQQALDAVDPVRMEASERDGATHFYRWGTSAITGDSGYPKTCPMNYVLNWPEETMPKLEALRDLAKEEAGCMASNPETERGPLRTVDAIEDLYRKGVAIRKDRDRWKSRAERYKNVMDMGVMYAIQEDRDRLRSLLKRYILRVIEAESVSFIGITSPTGASFQFTEAELEELKNLGAIDD